MSCLAHVYLTLWKLLFWLCSLFTSQNLLPGNKNFCEWALNIWKHVLLSKTIFFPPSVFITEKKFPWAQGLWGLIMNILYIEHLIEPNKTRIDRSSESKWQQQNSNPWPLKVIRTHIFWGHEISRGIEERVCGNQSSQLQKKWNFQEM